MSIWTYLISLSRSPTHDTCCETETRPREAAVPFDHPPTVQVKRTERRRRDPARGVASHRQPTDPASRRDLVRARVITPPPYDPQAAVPRGERGHVPRPSPTHSVARRHRVETPRSHHCRQRNRPAARALRRTPARQQVEDHAGATTRTPPQHGRPGDVVALPLRGNHGPRRHLPARHQDHRALSQLHACERPGTISETRSCTRSHTRWSAPATTPCGGPPRRASGARRTAASPSAAA